MENILLSNPKNYVKIVTHPLELLIIAVLSTGTPGTTGHRGE